MDLTDLSHASRLALRELCEQHGARVECYSDGGLLLSQKPTADRLGWSDDALELHHVLQRLGLVRTPGGWKYPATVPNDPMAGRDGYLFSAHYTLTRDPFPLASACSR